MKNILVLMIIHFYIFSTTYSERIGKWEQVLERESTANLYYGISAADSLNCMVFGVNGNDLFIKKTIDGGTTWKSIYHEYRIANLIFEPGYNTPRHIAFSDKNSCYVTLDSGNIIKTFNGGLTWSKVNITNENLKCITMYDSEIGVISTKKSLFLTKNSWSSWEKVALPDSLDNNYYIDYNVSLPTKDCIVAMIWNRSKYYTIRSDDFGDTWNLYSKGGLTGLDLKFINDTVGFTCMDRFYTDTMTHIDNREATINKTTNGGKTWLAVFDSSDYAGFWSIAFKDGVFYATGGFSRAYMSKDTGHTWINLYKYEDYSGEILQDWLWCTALTKDKILACTPYLGVWRFTNITTSVTENLKSDNLIVISPNPSSDFIEISVGANGCSPLQSDIKILNVYGQTVLSVGAIHELPLRFDVSGLAPGMYFVRIGDTTSKFVKI